MSHPMVVTYTSKKECPECTELKEFLRENKIEHRERNIDSDYEAREHMNNTLKANNKIPVIVVGSKVFIGYQRNIKGLKKELGIK